MNKVYIAGGICAAAYLAHYLTKRAIAAKYDKLPFYKKWLINLAVMLP